MPRYYYNLKDGHVSFDDSGTELADIMAARREAFLREGADHSLWAGEPLQVWVTDQPNGKGKTFFTRNAIHQPENTGRGHARICLEAGKITSPKPKAAVFGR